MKHVIYTAHGHNDEATEFRIEVTYCSHEHNDEVGEFVERSYGSNEHSSEAGEFRREVIRLSRTQ